jgi:hypothetical protein
MHCLVHIYAQHRYVVECERDTLDDQRVATITMSANSPVVRIEYMSKWWERENNGLNELCAKQQYIPDSVANLHQEVHNIH